MGEWDPDEVRRLFTSLEFRSLLDRLQEVGVDEAQGRGRRSWTSARSSADELAALIAADAPKGVRLDADAARGARRGRVRRGRAGRVRAAGRAGAGGGRAGVARTRRSGRTTRRSWSAARSPPGVEVAGVAFDTLLAGYLLDPGRRRVPAARAEREVPGRRRPRARSRSRTRASCSATPDGGRSPPRPRRSRCSRR